MAKRTRRRQQDQNVFSRSLVALMEEKQIGVREAAQIAGVAPSTIVSWRGGAYPEDFMAVKRIARALGVSLSFLLTGEDDTRPDGVPAVAEVFADGGTLFDGYAKITIQRLVPKKSE